MIEFKLFSAFAGPDPNKTEGDMIKFIVALKNFYYL